MRQQPVLSLKRGGSLRLQCQLQADGEGVPITSWQIDCWLRTPQGRQVAALTVQQTNSAQGRYDLSAEPSQTRVWPLGTLLADVRYRDPSGRVMHTCTFTVLVLDAITTPEP